MTIATILLILGIITSIATIAASFALHKQRLTSFLIVAGTLGAVQYSLVGNTVVLAVCIIGLARNLMILFSDKRPWLNHWLFIPIFMTIHTASFVTLNDWSHTTWLSFVPIVGSYLGVAALFFKDLMYSKFVFIVMGALWATYQFNFQMYGLMAGETVNLLINLWALSTLLAAKRNHIRDEDIKEVDEIIRETLTGTIPVITNKIQVLTGSIAVIKNKG